MHEFKIGDVVIVLGGLYRNETGIICKGYDHEGWVGVYFEHADLVPYMTRPENLRFIRNLSLVERLLLLPGDLKE
jgi:hypothetical protein